MIENKTQSLILKIIAHAVLLIVSLACLSPFLIIISASITSESALIAHGYGLLPRDITLEAYDMIVKNSKDLVGAYGVTIFITAVGCICSLLMIIMAAFPLSRMDYKWRTGLNFYFYFTMLFSGGMVPSYILISQYLHLTNNILVLILPMMFNVYNMFLMRTYFKAIPAAMWEAAEIDGAGQFKILFTIVVPMSVTGIATILLFVMLAYWNEWYHCLMYMTNEKTITLQFYLQKIMSQVNAIKQNAELGYVIDDMSVLPDETARMAICVIAAGPMVFVFTFFQKYFTKGLNLGSVKG